MQVIDTVTGKIKAVFGQYVDKVLHAIGGAAIGAGGVVVVWVTQHTSLWVAGVLAAALGGLAVEAYQLVRKEGVFSLLDAAATAVGGAVISLLVFFLTK